AYLTCHVGCCRTRDKCRHSTPPLLQNLQPKMPKPADADHSDFVCRTYLKLHNRVKNRNTTAKKWSGFARVKRVGQPESPSSMATYAVGKGSGSPDDCLLCLRAKVVIPAQTLWASHVAFGKPSKPDFVTDFQVFHLVASSNNLSDGFVPRNKRINRHLPFVVTHRQIRVTNSAVRNLDLDLFRFEFTSVKLK